MAWINELKKFYRVKEQKTYPWPCRTDQHRVVELFPVDILSKHPNGTVTKQSGFCMTNIQVPEDDLIEFNEPITMIIG